MSWCDPVRRITADVSRRQNAAVEACVQLLRRKVFRPAGSRGAASPGGRARTGSCSSGDGIAAVVDFWDGVLCVTSTVVLGVGVRVGTLNPQRSSCE